ncbi:hypothetical protein, variant [Aphanomyces invadans]|uniref:BRCT domain-containing protein n=1 Tax=Aphanomyces invadans TaxID=157072 RepID=A0A024TRN8_9STRA|nr:hypothetical protein, variant [Aphanomyces invadans]ETV96810.1 hypothetical protein, variant [Aphanomyces invadans]|eukprot:XP_008874586.1 hypothetical protein, variant [Aphanomyces invadans]
MEADASKYTVCSTGLTTEEIIVSKSIVAQLGMRWDDDLHDGVTHLLAVVVGSAKYKAAKAAKMKVVKLDWLKECSRAAKVLPTDQYELGPLEGLCICTTGLYVEDREKVQELCEAAGGIYHPDLNFGTTTHLLAEEPEGAKYNTAIAYGIPVVTLDWIVACVQAKEYKDEDAYRVQEHPVEMGPNVGVMDDGTLPCLKLNDQLQQCLTILDGEPPGCFLDGCVFWLTGFPPDVTTKLKALIRFGMGTRYDTYNTTVTHIVADFMGSCRQLQDSHGNMDVVAATWLINSCLAGSCLPEDQYPPPHIKTDYTVALHKPGTVVKPPGTLADRLHVATSTATASFAPPLKPTDTNPRLLFSGHMFLLVFTDALGSAGNLALKTQIKGVGGRYRELNTTDPCILQPNDMTRITHIVLAHGCDLPDGMLPSLCASMPRAKLVTELWLHCCLQDGVIYPRRKHELFVCSPNTHASVLPTLPLACFGRMHACISMFMGVERSVLTCLLRLCGATLTSKFSKRNTHLVCRVPDGPKYIKAVEWKVPVVDANWLVTSASAAMFQPYPTLVQPRRGDAPDLSKKRKSLDSIRNEDETGLPSAAKMSQVVGATKGGLSQDDGQEHCPVKPPERENHERGALTQLEHLLGDMGGDESCSMDYPYDIVPAKPAQSPPTKRQDKPFFQDSQAAAPHSEMVQYEEA